MHRHSGGHRRDPFFAEIQYRGQKTPICESEKRDASGCLRKVLRLPRSVFSKSSFPKLTPHISTGFVHDGTISSKKLSWHILSWHASRAGAAECAAPRRHPWRRAPTRSRAQLRRRLSQGTLMDEARGPADESETGVCGAGIGRFASRAARCLEQCSDEGGRWWGRWRKLRSETALPHCCLLPRKSTRPSCAAKVGRDCLRRCPFASSWLRSVVLFVILSIEQIEQTMRETTRQAKPNPSTIRGGTCGHPD